MGQPSDTDNVSHLSYHQLFTVDKAILKGIGQSLIYSANKRAKQLQHSWDNVNQDIMDVWKLNLCAAYKFNDTLWN